MSYAEVLREQRVNVGRYRGGYNDFRVPEYDFSYEGIMPISKLANNMGGTYFNTFGNFRMSGGSNTDHYIAVHFGSINNNVHVCQKHGDNLFMGKMMAGIYDTYRTNSGIRYHNIQVKMMVGVKNSEANLVKEILNSRIALPKELLFLYIDPEIDRPYKSAKYKGLSKVYRKYFKSEFNEGVNIIKRNLEDFRVVPEIPQFYKDADRQRTIHHHVKSLL